MDPKLILQSKSDSFLEKSMMSIIEDTKKLRNKIPEHIFKAVILPIITSKEEIDLSNWIKLSGNVFLPIDVVDSDGSTFTVPPICARVITSISKSNISSLSHIAVTAKNKSDVLPQLGEKFLKNTLSIKQDQLKVDYNWGEEWAYIYNRYGIKNDSLEETPTEEVKTTKMIFSDESEDF